MTGTADATSCAGIRGTASFGSVEALPGRGPGEPIRAFAGGFFTFELRFGPQDSIFSQSGTDGVLAGFVRDVPGAPWTPDWLLQGASDGGDASVTGNDILMDHETRRGLTNAQSCAPISAVQFKGFSDALNIFGL